MEKKFFLALCLAAVLLSAGCNSPPQEVKENKVDNTVKAEDKPVATTNAVTQPKPAEGVLDDLKNLFASRPTEYMVEYNTKISIDSQPETSGAMAFYYKGDDNIRTDTFTEGMETRIYMVKGELVMCTKQSGEWSCMQLPSAQGQTEDVNKNMDEMEKNFQTNPVTKLPDRTIAGVNCKCFNVRTTVNEPQAQGTGATEYVSTYCVSPEGVPLYTETRSKQLNMIMEATKYSTRVSDSDLVPPAKPVDMMEAMGGGSIEQQPERPIPTEGGNPGEPEPILDRSRTCEICNSVPDEEGRAECLKTMGC